VDMPRQAPLLTLFRWLGLAWLAQLMNMVVSNGTPRSIGGIDLALLLVFRS
jgi:hypothetical protein